jgi:hypothetical protein
VTLGGYLLTEVLFGVSLLAFALAFLTAIERRSFAWAAAAGLLAGWTYLVNEVALVLVLGLTALHAALAWRRTSGAERARLLRCMTIVTLLFAAFPVGWSVREAVSVGDPALRGSARAVQTMSHGAYPDFIHRNPAFREYPYLDDPEQPEFGSSFGAFSRILAKRVAERPLRYASWYLFEKPYWLWSWRILQGDPNEDIYVYPVERSLYRQFAPAEWSCILMQLLHLPLVVLAFYAAFLCVRGVRGSASFDAALALPLLPAAVLILVTVLYTVFACWSRYAVPFRPVLYVAAVWGAAELVQRLRARA